MKLEQGQAVRLNLEPSGNGLRRRRRIAERQCGVSGAPPCAKHTGVRLRRELGILQRLVQLPKLSAARRTIVEQRSVCLEVEAAWLPSGLAETGAANAADVGADFGNGCSRGLLVRHLQRERTREGCRGARKLAAPAADHKHTASQARTALQGEVLWAAVGAA